MPLHVCIPPVQHQGVCTGACAGDWAGAVWWWSGPRWCGSADSRWRSSGWCSDRPAGPPPLGSSVLNDKRDIYCWHICKIPTVYGLNSTYNTGLGDKSILISIEIN